MKYEGEIRGIFTSLLGIALAVVLISMTFRDVVFYFDKNIVAVTTPEDVGKLHDNVITEITLKLDFEKAYGVSYLSEREFLLIPFSGVGYKLMYVIEGPMTSKTVASLIPPFKGRVVGKGFADGWDVYGKSIKLKGIFARDHITLPDGTMLVYDAPKELPSVWQFILAAFAVVYLAYKALKLTRLFRPKKGMPPSLPVVG